MEPITINNIDNIKNIIETIVSSVWYLALIGIIIALLFEYKKIYTFLTNKKKSRRNLSFLLPRLGYVASGIIATTFSWKIVTFFFYITQSSGNKIPVEAMPSGYRLIDLIRQTAHYAGLFSTIGCIIGGLLITISAGDNRCIRTAKICYFISFLYLLASALIWYSI